MAPILSFTAEEIWTYMPERKDKETSIHLASLPVVNEELKDEELAQKWGLLLKVRGEVTKALEQARTAKLIGHPLDASVTILANRDLYNNLHPYTEDLKSIFIVSQASLIKEETLSGAYKSNDIEGLLILVEPAAGDKCERCWIHDTSVGTNTEYPTICSRCKENIKGLRY